jgi:hypothetical protein
MTACSDASARTRVSARGLFDIRLRFVGRVYGRTSGAVKEARLRAPGGVRKRVRGGEIPLPVRDRSASWRAIAGRAASPVES